MDSLLLQLARLGQFVHLGPHESRLLAWGILLLAAALCPLLAWRLVRQRADIRSISSSLREGTRAGGALPHIPQARTSPVRTLSAELVDWAHRHSHQIHWMRGWTQKRAAEWRSLREQLARLTPASPPEPAGRAAAGETGETLARAVREMEVALQAARTLARTVRGMAETDDGPQTAVLRAALEEITRSLAGGAQLLAEVQGRLEPDGDGSPWHQDGTEALERMMALAEEVAEEHRKMEGDLAKLLEGFLPGEASPAEERISPDMWAGLFPHESDVPQGRHPVP